MLGLNSVLIGSSDWSYRNVRLILNLTTGVIVTSQIEFGEQSVSNFDTYKMKL